MLKIGLTGGIASGKSSACDYFRKLGVTIIDADAIARTLFAPLSPHLDALRQHFGDSIFNTDRTLNRKTLRRLVFNDKEALRWLNEFTHPLVRQEILNKLKEIQTGIRDIDAPNYLILDIPLLVNKDGQIPDYLADLIDKIIVVDVSPERQIQRLQKRDKQSEEAAQKVLDSQASRGQRLAVADIVINNERDLASLKRQVIEIHHDFVQQPI